MGHQPGVFLPNALLAGLSATASAATVAAGIWMLARQDLYIDTGTDPFGLAERSFNWWGLAIGIGLILGGVTGLFGLVLRQQIFLIAAGFVVASSAMWHPVFWPLFGGVPLLFLLSGTGFSARTTRSATGSTGAASLTQ